MVDHRGTSGRPAFYAARPGGLRDWWNVLHPPYTAWHLSYVVIGASLAPRVDLDRMLLTLLAFFLAVGVAAHALDELHGRPLGTGLARPLLIGATSGGLAGAVALGLLGLHALGWRLVPFLVVGPLLVVAYSWELLGGVVHSALGFAVAWGAFPVVVAYVAQTGRLAVGPVLAAGGAAAMALVQRRLSTAARLVRRQAVGVSGQLTLDDGRRVALNRGSVLSPLEGALQGLSLAMVLLAAALATARLG